MHKMYEQMAPANAQMKSMVFRHIMEHGTDEQRNELFMQIPLPQRDEFIYGPNVKLVAKVPEEVEELVAERYEPPEPQIAMIGGKQQGKTAAMHAAMAHIQQPRPTIAQLAANPDMLDALMNAHGPKNPTKYMLSALPAVSLPPPSKVTRPGTSKRKKNKAARKKAKRHKKRSR